MWYFAWILGLGFALTLGILNAMWFELREVEAEARRDASVRETPDC